MNEIQRINDLTLKYKAGTLTDAEKAELDNWLDANENRRQLWEDRINDQETSKRLPLLYEASVFKER